MKKFNFSKTAIIALIIILAAMATISVTATNYRKEAKPKDLTKIINDGAAGIDRLFAAPGAFLEAKAADFQHVLNVYSQSESLKKQLSGMTNQKQQLEAALQENKELKAALDLKSTLANYTTTAATVITRNPSSWNDIFVIDKGTDAGLTNNMIVMANGGIIGRITQVNTSSSKVELLTGAKNLINKIPVKLGNSYGLLDKYDDTKNQYLVTNLNTSEDFTKGEKVVTSGLGGDSPSNLGLGTVVGQKGKSTDADRVIYVKPTSNFYDIHIVTVVQRQIEGKS